MRNYFKQLFSHIPPRFQFNGIFQQSERLQKYFLSIVITSSLSFIYVQIFRLLLKISVYERHQLRIQTIYEASCEEAITLLDLVDSKYTLGSFAMYLHRETFPNQSFHQIIDNSTQVEHKNGKLCKKCFDANSTQCSQAVTHPSTD